MMRKVLPVVLRGLDLSAGIQWGSSRAHLVFFAAEFVLDELDFWML